MSGSSPNRLVLHLTSEGQGQVLERLFKAGTTVQTHLMLTMNAIGDDLLTRMRAKNQLKKRKGGKLERAFYHRVSVKNGGQLVILVAGVARRAFYAAFQDRGVPRKGVDVKGYVTGTRTVGAYKREMYLNPKPFIGVSLVEMRAQIAAELRAAVHEAIAGGP